MLEEQNGTQEASEKRSLQKVGGEGDNAHRALLLYAMCSPKKRSLRAVSRAMGLSAPTISEYKKRWGWEERMDSEGLTLESKAQELYRVLYTSSQGMREVSVIQDRIITPISVVGNTPRGVADTVELAIKNTEKPAASEFDKEVKSKHLMLIDAAIAYVAKSLKHGDIKASFRDLPMLISLRDELIDDGKTQISERKLLESIRVRDAKSLGGDIVEAMFEDSLEITSVLRSLTSRNKAPREGALQYSKERNDG